MTVRREPATDPSILARKDVLDVALAPHHQALPIRRVLRLVRVDADFRPAHLNDREPLAHVDMKAHAGVALAREDGAKRRPGRGIARDVIGLAAAEPQRRLVGRVDHLLHRRAEAHYAHLRRGEVAATEVAILRLGAEESRRYHDQVRKARDEPAPIDPETLVERGSVGIKKYIARSEQLEQKLAAARVAKVERHAELVGVEVEVKPTGFRISFLPTIRTPSAIRRATLWRFDLDYFRAEVGHHLGGHRRGEERHRIEARQLDNL